MNGSGKLALELRRIVVAFTALVVLLALVPAAASADDNPPFINSASFSPADLPSSGGTVTVTASVVDDVGVGEVHADVSGDVNTSVVMTHAGSDNWSGTFEVPPNSTDLQQAFFVEVYATDSNGALAELFAGQGSVAQPMPLDEPPVVLDPSVTPVSIPYTGGNVSLGVTARDAGGSRTPTP